MDKLIGQYSPFAFAALRIISGLMFTCHGAQKLFGFFGNPHPGVSLASTMGIAGIIELICGVLIALGLFGSYAAFLASGEMAAAYFMAHFPQSFFPIVNKGELAVLYCFVFFYIAFHGSGRWSLDYLLSGSQHQRR